MEIIIDYGILSNIIQGNDYCCRHAKPFDMQYSRIKSIWGLKKELTAEVLD